MRLMSATIYCHLLSTFFFGTVWKTAYHNYSPACLHCSLITSFLQWMSHVLSFGTVDMSCWHYILFSLGLRNNVPWHALNSTLKFCYCIPFVNTPNDSRFGTVSSFTQCPAVLLVHISTVNVHLWITLHSMHEICYYSNSLVPRPRGRREKWPGVHCFAEHQVVGLLNNSEHLVFTVSQLVRWFITYVYIHFSIRTAQSIPLIATTFFK